MSEKIIKSYKAFNKNMQCRGFQYEVGKEYDMNGDIKCCKRGFHACESPMDTWYYYDMLNSRFAEVEQSGKIDTIEGIKICSSHIKIKREIDLSDFINSGIDWVKTYTMPSKIPTNDTVLNDSGVENTLIYSSHHYEQIGSSGNNAKIHSDGNYTCISSSGFDVTISSSGDGTKISSSGNYTLIGTSSNRTIINTSGDYSNICSSGEFTHISSLGSSSNIGSLGNWAKISSLGNDIRISSFGNNANINSSGFDTKVSSMGKNSIIICTGKGSMVKAEVGSYITLVEYKWNDSKNHFTIVCVKTEYVDGERIKANTWYKLINGKFVEIYS